jgi:hypothetical protein
VQAEVDTAIAKVVTSTTNKLTDARALSLDNLDMAISDLPTAVQPVFIFDATKQNNFAAIAGTWARNASGAYNTGAILNSDTAAANDEVALGIVYLPETASYTAYAIRGTDTDQGIMHIHIDGVDEGQIDNYAASSPNAAGSVSLGSLSAGAHTLSIMIDTKNGSSTGYGCRLSVFAIAKS